MSRVVRDALGTLTVGDDVLWGAQTERSTRFFNIGNEQMPREIIKALAAIKAACARANADLGKLDAERASNIVAVADDICAGQLWDQFPLKVWQTGSGTQSNMNVNEVIATRIEQLNPECSVHPNDIVNMSQSSNDVFPSALHIAAAELLVRETIPALECLIEAFKDLEERSGTTIACGRTHLQDAVPLYFSDEVWGWRGLLERAHKHLSAALEDLYELALGGTAVGTGLNASREFRLRSVAYLSEAYQLPFVADENTFSALTGKNALCHAHSALNELAAHLLKIVNDIRLLASGPRCGLGELKLPANEPGSSIMPGKVNPTQAEAVSMVCVRVMGNDTTMHVAASQGHFQLNVYMPVMGYTFLQSAQLLADVMRSFATHCVAGIELNHTRIQQHMERSLMLVTCLSEEIGYAEAARIAHYAHEHDVSLKEATLALGSLEETRFDALVRPELMVDALHRHNQSSQEDIKAK